MNLNTPFPSPHNAFGMTSLHIAVMRNDFNTTKALLDAKADPDPRLHVVKFTPLHLAVQTDPNLDIIQLLVDAGADMNATCSLYWTNQREPVFLAIRTSMEEMGVHD